MNVKVFLACILTSLPAMMFTSCSDDDPVYEDPTVGVESESNEVFFYGETKDFSLTVGGDYLSTSVSAPEGWTAIIEDGTLKVSAPQASVDKKASAGEIVVVAKGHDEIEATAKFDVKALYQITFEGVDDGYLASDPYGANLYNGDYAGYIDEVSNMMFHTTVSGYYFASGGIAISQWNDKTTEGFKNQCSVYYGEDGEKNGGCDNSKTFAVAFHTTFGESGALISFADDKEREIDHAYFTNNTYATLSMMKGDGFAKKFSYEDKDWFKLTLKGENAAGEPTGEVEIYLADFRTADAGSIVTEWTKVDLKPLGKVSKITFDMSSSDGGQWGMNTPAYFCMDNIAINL